jgi:RNA polymerase sigma-70 factor (ECF subfamily)
LNQIKQLVNQDVYEIMVMHLVRGLKFKEIAALKQVSVAVVLGQYHRAMKKIRKEIKL